MSAPIAKLIERLRAATMGFDWADLPDDACVPAVPLLREAADALASSQEEIARLRKALIAQEALSALQLRMLEEAYLEIDAYRSASQPVPEHGGE